jgi:hypothetical protein
MIAFIDDHREACGVEPIRKVLPIAADHALQAHAPHQTRSTVASSAMFPLPHAVTVRMIDRTGPFFCSTRASAALSGADE